MTNDSQRAELHKTIWAIADDLRGSVDGWDFKQYVLGMLFYRFISENLSDYLNKMEAETGDLDFDYVKLSDAEAEFGRAETVREKGFYILPRETLINECFTGLSRFPLVFRADKLSKALLGDITWPLVVPLGGFKGVLGAVVPMPAMSPATHDTRRAPT